MGLAVTRMMNVLFGLLAPAMLAMPAGMEPAAAGKPEVDKSVFNLFNPTPAEYLRALDTDGPGSTESPYTVDAGHFQIEMTLVSYTSDRESFNGVMQRFEAWAISPMHLKIGMLNRLNAQRLLERDTRHGPELRADREHSSERGCEARCNPLGG